MSSVASKRNCKQESKLPYSDLSSQYYQRDVRRKTSRTQTRPSAIPMQHRLAQHKSCRHPGVMLPRSDQSRYNRSKPCRGHHVSMELAVRDNARPSRHSVLLTMERAHISSMTREGKRYEGA